LQSTKTILDAHVHIHDCFDISDFLDHAHENFSAQSKVDSSSQDFSGVLLLTESFGTNWYRKLRQSAGSADDFAWKNWRIERNGEAESVTAVSRSGQTLTIIAGRQIVTAERLEILSPGLDEEIDDGLPIEDVIALVQERQALCILPWGFGKWTGNRGQIVRAILDGEINNNFFIGDNAGRLSIWPAPAEFATATNRNIRILPGSDPLPYASQVASVARFGFSLPGALDRSHPFADLRNRLLESESTIEPYGSLERIIPFVTNQVAMQLRKFTA
jgi:hypothetical protein